MDFYANIKHTKMEEESKVLHLHHRLYLHVLYDVGDVGYFGFFLFLAFLI